MDANFKKVFMGIVIGLASSSSFGAPLGTYNIDINQTSVSGISSGGYAAQQFHVIYSDIMVGAAVFAGGPYFCAEGDALVNGLGRCMNGGITQANLDSFLSRANTEANSGKIDALSNLASDKIYLFAGTQDTTVKPEVMNSLKTWYTMAGVPAANIQYVNTMNAGHTWPTLSYGGSCSTTADPWIGNCNYDASGILLQHIYGSLNARNNGTLSGQLKTFDQTEFFGASPHGSVKSFTNTGYVYVPASCESGASCKIHVSFHGCKQNSNEAFGTKYVSNVGLNEWADTNNIIVLYPQAKKMTSNPTNPNGCADFWGYEEGGYGPGAANAVYHTNEGIQTSAVFAMVERIAGITGGGTGGGGTGGGTGGGDPEPGTGPCDTVTATGTALATQGLAVTQYSYLSYTTGDNQYLGMNTSSYTVYAGSDGKGYKTDPANCGASAPPANTAPAITMSGGSMTLTVGDTFVDPGATAADAEDGNLTSSMTTNCNVNMSTAGNYTCTYSVTDSGGLSDQKVRNVTVEAAAPPPSNTAPVVTMSGSNMTLNVGDTFVDPGATASDAEDGNLTSSISTNCNVNMSTAGNYTCTYSVTDSGGLSDQKVRNVTVEAAAPPPPPPSSCTQFTAANYSHAMASRATYCGMNICAAGSGQNLGSSLTSTTIRSTTSGYWELGSCP